MSIVWSTISGVVMLVVGYVIAKRKIKSEIGKTNAETDKIKTENKLIHIESFEKLNRLLDEQNIKLIESNERLIKSNENLMCQNKKLMKNISLLEERISKIEEDSKLRNCNNAPGCLNRIY